MEIDECDTEGTNAVLKAVNNNVGFGIEWGSYEHVNGPSGYISDG
jgi:hypothetical protein